LPATASRRAIPSSGKSPSGYARRDRIAPSIPIAILSNSTTCMYYDVRNGLRRVDERHMKLDAATHSR
jgi:hypothetical protein